MPGIGTAESTQVPDTAGKSSTPPPRGKPLNTLEQIRREMVAVYNQERIGSIAMDRAKGKVYLLGQIAAVMRIERGTDDEVAALLAQVRDKLKGNR